MANYGKRMVPEYLIKTLEGVDKKIQGNADNINLMENIVDSNGNKRFIEGTLITSTVAGYTFGYKKWSLSGSHLMIVLAGNVAAGSTLADNAQLAKLSSLPSWIVNKIIPISSNTVLSNSINFYKQGAPWVIETFTLSLDKTPDNEIVIKNNTGNFTNTNDDSFRIQFDLLIDND